MDKRQPKHYEKCHFILKMSIWLTATAYPTALFVTIVFWSFLYNFNATFNFNLGSYINLTTHLFQVMPLCKALLLFSSFLAIILSSAWYTVNSKVLVTFCIFTWVYTKICVNLTADVRTYPKLKVISLRTYVSTVSYTHLTLPTTPYV